MNLFVSLSCVFIPNQKRFSEQPCSNGEPIRHTVLREGKRTTHKLILLVPWATYCSFLTHIYIYGIITKRLHNFHSGFTLIHLTAKVSEVQSELFCHFLFNQASALFFESRSGVNSECERFRQTRERETLQEWVRERENTSWRYLVVKR